MTGYYLETGYNSASTRDDVWTRLKAITEDLCTDPARIAQEVSRLEPSLAESEVRDYAEAYRLRQDLTIKIVEEPPPHVDPAEFQPYVQQLASGGGTARKLKEACRRAFCRLVIEAMHRERLEVTMRVT